MTTPLILDEKTETCGVGGVGKKLRKEKSSMKRPEIGAQYRVVKPGAKLFWWVPAGPNCQQGAGLTLEVGDVITYERHAYGGGSDDVYYDYFRKADKCGQFWPNNWGTCDVSFLEPVGAT